MATSIVLPKKLAKRYLDDAKHIPGAEKIITRDPTTGKVILDASDPDRFIVVTAEQAKALKGMKDREQRLIKISEDAFVLDVRGSIRDNGYNSDYTEEWQRMAAALVGGSIGLLAPVGIPYAVWCERKLERNKQEIAIYGAFLGSEAQSAAAWAALQNQNSLGILGS